MPQSIPDDSHFEIAERLKEVSEKSNGDGTISAEVLSFDVLDGIVTVYFVTLMGEEQSESMPWPKRDDEQYKFVRVCNETVDGLENAEQLVGSEVRVDPDNWEIVTSRSTIGKLLGGGGLLDKSREYYYDMIIGLGSLILLALVVITTVGLGAASLIGVLFYPSTAITSTVVLIFIIVLPLSPFIAGAFDVIARANLVDKYK